MFLIDNVCYIESVTKTDTPASGSEEAPKDAQQPASEDTATAQNSETSKSVENQAPEATQGKEEQENSETEAKNAEDTAEEKLYAGKYKTAEEMERAYKELQSKYSQTSSEKAELSKTLQDSLVTPPGDGKKQDTETTYDYQEDSSDPRIEKLERNQSIANFVFAHPDADGGSMTEVLKSDPYISNITGYEAKLEYAYLRSQNMTKNKAIEEAEKTSAEKTQSKIAEKQAAQVESSNKSEPDDESGDLMNKATQGTPDERKQARLEVIRKNLINL